MIWITMKRRNLKGGRGEREFRRAAKDDTTSGGREGAREIVKIEIPDWSAESKDGIPRRFPFTGNPTDDARLIARAGVRMGRLRKSADVGRMTVIPWEHGQRLIESAAALDRGELPDALRMKVKIDPAVPPGEVRFESADGSVVGRIVGVESVAGSPIPPKEDFAPAPAIDVRIHGAENLKPETAAALKEMIDAAVKTPTPPPLGLHNPGWCVDCGGPAATAEATVCPPCEAKRGECSACCKDAPEHDPACLALDPDELALSLSECGWCHNRIAGGRCLHANDCPILWDSRRRASAEDITAVRLREKRERERVAALERIADSMEGARRALEALAAALTGSTEAFDKAREPLRRASWEGREAEDRPLRSTRPIFPEARAALVDGINAAVEEAKEASPFDPVFYRARGPLCRR